MITPLAAFLGLEWFQWIAIIGLIALIVVWRVIKKNQT